MVFSFLTEFIQLLSSDTIYLCSWSGDMYLKEYIELLYHPSIGRVRGKKNQQSQTKQVHVSLYVLFSTRNFLIILREGSNKQILKYQSFFFLSCLRKTSMLPIFLSIASPIKKIHPLFYPSNQLNLKFYEVFFSIR